MEAILKIFKCNMIHVCKEDCKGRPIFVWNFGKFFPSDHDETTVLAVCHMILDSLMCDVKQYVLDPFFGDFGFSVFQE